MPFSGLESLRGLDTPLVLMLKCYRPFCYVTVRIHIHSYGTVQRQLRERTRFCSEKRVRIEHARFVYKNCRESIYSHRTQGFICKRPRTLSELYA